MSKCKLINQNFRKTSCWNFSSHWKLLEKYLFNFFMRNIFALTEINNLVNQIEYFNSFNWINDKITLPELRIRSWQTSIRTSSFSTTAKQLLNIWGLHLSLRHWFCIQILSMNSCLHLWILFHHYLKRVLELISLRIDFIKLLFVFMFWFMMLIMNDFVLKLELLILVFELLQLSDCIVLLLL